MGRLSVLPCNVNLINRRVSLATHFKVNGISLISQQAGRNLKCETSQQLGLLRRDLIGTVMSEKMRSVKRGVISQVRHLIIIFR